MLLAGDEIGHTQNGNNNAYCQDNEISWIDWELDRPRQDMLEFTRYVIKIFQEQPVLRRRHFFQGRKIRGSEVKDLTWFRLDGKEMTEDDWNNSETRCFGLRLAGDAIEELDERGNRVVGDTLLILLNSHYEPLPFVLPAHRPRLRWELLLDTRQPLGRDGEQVRRAGEVFDLEGRSFALFRLHGEPTNGEQPAARPRPRRKSSQGERHA
jgi:glycogen operon protein